MNIENFCQEKNLKYIRFSTLVENNNKKTYKGIIKGWKDMTRLERYTHNKKTIDYTHVLINCTNDYLIFDTDDEESYNKLTQILKKNNIYNEEQITKSTRGDLYHYKRHFWFRIENVYRFKDLQKHKFNNMEVFIGPNCSISEDKKTLLKVDTVLTYIMYNDIEKLFSKEEVKQEEKINEDLITVTSDKKLFKILDSLKPCRFTDYNDWIRIYWVFINESFPLELFHYFSKKHYERYNFNDNQKILNQFKYKTNGLKMPTLYKMLKEDNIRIFNELQSTREDIWELFSDLKTHSQFANYYYQMNPTSYIKSNISGWYEYNENNILIPRGNTFPCSMLNNITNFFQTILIEARNNLIPNHENYTQKMKIFKNAYTAVGKTTFINNIKEYLTHLYTVEAIDDLIDSNINLIAFDNMLYDNTIKDFRDIKPTDYISKTTKYSINTRSNHELRTYITNLIKNMFASEEVYNYHLQTIALSLFGNINETFIINSGRGRNGKGICGQLIENALGNYFYSGESTFYTTVFKADRPNSTLYNLKGVRYFLTTEPEADTDTKFNIGLIKKTTGNDTITTRDLNKSNISYKPQFTPFLQCNNKPKIDSIDEAIKNRFRIIDFPFTFCNNPSKPNEKKIDITIKENLTKEMYNEFMLMLLDISKTLDKNLKVPREVLGNVDEYLNSNNDVKRWIDEIFTINDNKKDCHQAQLLLAEYNAVGDYVNMNPKKFSEQMKLNNIPSKLVHGVKFYYGLKRKDDIDAPNELDF